MRARQPSHGRLAWCGAALLAALLLTTVACQPVRFTVAKSAPGGDPQAGAQSIRYYGCGSCHQIPGIQGANAYVGPPLEHFDRRHYIAGKLPNTTDNLIIWLMNPQSVEPGTAMPDMGLNEMEARNIAAYLYGQ